MMDAWYDMVGADDTIICLGDVSVDGSVQAHHQRWWREAPGVKWLVLGNHDVDPVNQTWPGRGGPDRGHAVRTRRSAAAADARTAVAGAARLVNVHGHVHQKESPSRNRHINVSVEQLNYRPARLSDIRRLARRLLEGRNVPGHSTRARLNVVELVVP